MVSKLHKLTVQEAQNAKDTENAQGSGQLLIPLDPQLNEGQDKPEGGLNT